MIKKFLSLGLVSLMLSAGAIAATTYDEVSMCPKAPYPISNKFSQAFSKYSGINFTVSNLAEHEMTKAFKKMLGSDVKVNFKLYSIGDFADGKFRSMVANSEKLNINGITLSDFNARTLCDFNYIIPRDDKVLFPENMLIAFDTKLTTADLQSIINSQNLSALDLSVGRLTVFKVLSAKAEIVDNRIRFKTKLRHPFSFFKSDAEVSVSAGLKAENGDLVFADVKYESTDKAIDMASIMPWLNMFKPLEQKIQVFPGTTALVKTKNVSITNNTVNIDGLMLVQKNYTQGK